MKIESLKSVQWFNPQTGNWWNGHALKDNQLVPPEGWEDAVLVVK